MECDEPTEQNRDRLIDGEQMTASGLGKFWVEGLNKKEKGLMDMVNSMVIAGGESIRRLNNNGKNIIKIK